MMETLLTYMNAKLLKILKKIIYVFISEQNVFVICAVIVAQEKVLLQRNMQTPRPRPPRPHPPPHPLSLPNLLVTPFPLYHVHADEVSHMLSSVYTCMYIHVCVCVCENRHGKYWETCQKTFTPLLYYVAPTSHTTHITLSYSADSLSGLCN